MTQTSRFLLRFLKFAPTSVSANHGKSTAKYVLLIRLCTDAVAATVLTVSVGVPLPPLSIAELKSHLGGTEVAGVMAQVRLTVELKPPVGATVIVDVAEVPRAMVAGVNAVAVSAKDGVDAVTVRPAVAVCTRLPKVPVIVKLNVPPAVDVVVFTVSGALACVLPDGTGIEAGEQEAPEGSPEQVKVTVPENPGCGVA